MAFSARNILIAGSSHVRNMTRFIEPYAPGASTNVLCMPGALVNDVRERLVSLEDICLYDLIFVVVGSNDITLSRRRRSARRSLNRHPSDIANDMMILTDELMQITRARLVVCQPLPRTEGRFMNSRDAALHNRMVRKVVSLTARLGYVFPAPLLCRGDSAINFRRDGVHLSGRGCQVLAAFLCLS